MKRMEMEEVIVGQTDSTINVELNLSQIDVERKNSY